jgi:anaerobic ribonucleoside-triphosphate reductase activating protein
MMIRISRVHYPVTVLGPGRRLGIWLQGCSLGCKGCVSKDTWNPDAGRLIDVETLVEQCRELVKDDLNGITITGGAPFEQLDALSSLLDELKPWRASAGFDILCYSGKPYKHLQQQYPNILSQIDLLIPEAFVESRPTDAIWRGSANQPLIPLSNLGHSKLKNLDKAEAPAIQVQVQDGAVWFIGIPRRGDMDKLQALLKNRGVLMEKNSWN